MTLLGCSAVLLATGCGSDDEGDPIPQNLAGEMQTQLDNIQRQIESETLGACQDILSSGNTFAALRGAVDQVPNDVGEDVRDALRQSVNRLGELVEERCTELENEPNTDTETTEEPETEGPVETQTETLPTETEEEPPPEEETEEPPLEEEKPGNGPKPGKGPSGGTSPDESGGVPAPGDEG
jgi:hypothetical protein